MMDTLAKFIEALAPLAKFPWMQFLIAVLTWRAVRLIVFSVPRAEFLREVERLDSERKREAERLEKDYLKQTKFLLVRIARTEMRLAKLEGP